MAKIENPERSRRVENPERSRRVKNPERKSNPVSHRNERSRRKVKPKTKKKTKRQVPAGCAYITATFNNTMVTITDPEGNVLLWGSAGSAGFKGTKRSTPFAAQTAINEIANKALGMGMKEISVFVKGPGSGREAAIRSLQGAGLIIKSIADVTPIPHNGCRPPKRRRV